MRKPCAPCVPVPSQRLAACCAPWLLCLSALLGSVASNGAATSVEGDAAGEQANAASKSLQARALQRVVIVPPVSPTDLVFHLRVADPYAELRQLNLLRLDMGAQGRLRLKVRGGGLTLSWQAEW